MNPLNFIYSACKMFEIDSRQVLGKCKKHIVVDFRKILMDILYEQNLTQQKVADIFGKNRTTLSYNKWEKKPIVHFTDRDIETLKQLYNNE